MNTARTIALRSTEDLIREGASLKQAIDHMTAKLRDINKELAALAEFKDGGKTGHLAGAGYKVRVQLKDNVSWDQEKLRQLRDHLPAGHFDRLFRMVFEPASKKILDSFLEHGEPDLIEGIRWAMQVKTGAPQVTYEQMEE
jgi:hypothetical protein